MIIRNKILIVGKTYQSVSETFIDNHIKYISSEVVLLYGQRWNIRYQNGKYVWPLMRFVCELIARITHYRDNKLLSALIKRLILKYQPEAILAEYGTNGVFLYPAANALKIPLLVHFHGFDISKQHILKRYSREYANMSKSVKSIFVVSETMKNKLQELGVNNDKIVLNHYGVDQELFKPDLNFDSTSSNFIMIGRLVPKKAPQITIKAFMLAKEELNNGVNDLSLLVVGDGKMRQVCEKIVESSPYKKSVKFMGFLNPNEVASLMSKSIAFLQHSVTAEDGDMEGLPLAIIEAQMSGKAVISTYHAGIPEVVLHGETGFLVKEKDVEGMAQSILILSTNEALVSKMSINARQRALKYFSLHKHIANIQSSILQ